MEAMDLIGRGPLTAWQVMKEPEEEGYTADVLVRVQDKGTRRNDPGMRVC